MLRTILTAPVLLAAFALGGCAGKGGKGSGDTSNLPSTSTELAAYAGNARFPQVQATNYSNVAAVLSRNKKQIVIYNFGEQAIRSVDVWVNGSFVKPLGGIAPLSNVAINTNEIYNGLGHTLASRGEEVSRVQLQSGDQLYTLMGPVAE
jgi:hypothetical protein